MNRAIDSTTIGLLPTNWDSCVPLYLSLLLAWLKLIGWDDGCDLPL